MKLDEQGLRALLSPPSHKTATGAELVLSPSSSALPNKNALIFALGITALTLGAVSRHAFSSSPYWNKTIAGIVLGGFAISTTHALLPSLSSTAPNGDAALLRLKQNLGLTTYTLGAWGTGIAIMSLIDGKKASA